MSITEFISELATDFIDKTGYVSVFILMVMESMVFPIPSEAVMPFAGFLIVESRFTFFGVVSVSGLASVTGSLLSYWIGLYGGKPFLDRFGKFFLLNKEDLEFTEKFFKKRGEITIFISRFIPVVRHLISIPAGIGKMNLFRFTLYTLLGATMWNAILTVAGYFLKQNWKTIMKYSHTIDYSILTVFLIFITFFVIRRLKKRR